MRKKLHLLIITLFLSISAFAQSGTIKGVVNDKKMGRPVFGAKVFVEGTLYGAMTDMNGNYTLNNVKAGTYNVTCFYLLYGNTVKEEITVLGDQTTTVDFDLGEQVKEMQGIQVVIKQNKETENQALIETQKETKVVEIVSAAEMSKKGDSKASDAVKRVSGVSVVGGKYVFVRGLSDRYTKTILNGAEIPGLDPNRNSVQLDLFPSAFIRSIKIIKTFSPDLPGDFSGGLVDLRLKEYPDSFYVKVNGSLGYNPQVAFQDNYILGQRSSTDWLGFDNGQRDVPPNSLAAIDNNTWPDRGSNLLPGEEGQANANKIDLLTKEWNNDMAPSNQSNFLNHSFGISGGNKWDIPLKKDTLRHRTYGFFAGLNYKRTYSFYENGKIGLYNLSDDIDSVGGKLNENRNFNVTQGKDEVLIGATVNNTFKFNNRHKLRLDLIHNQSGTHMGRISEGVNDDISQEGASYRQQTIRYTQRSLSALQLSGEHKWDSVWSAKSPMKLEFLVSPSLAKQNTPDLRYWSDIYFEDGSGNTVYDFQLAAHNAPSRFTRTMEEFNNDAKIHLTAPIDYRDSLQMKVKVGLSHVLKDRDFQESYVEYNDLESPNLQVPYTGDAQSFLTNDNLGIVGPGSKDVGVGIYNRTEQKNSYTGYQTVTGAYGMIDLPAYKTLRFIGGARFEATDVEIVSKDPEKDKGQQNYNDILPSVNFIYGLMNKRVQSKLDSNKMNRRNMKLRASWNRTLARPSFRELAPFAAEDFDRNIILQGNDSLDRTNIDNLDFRWEYFPKTGELISVTAFYKYFQNPIELVINPVGNKEMVYRNNEDAKVFGVELEFRKSLDFISPKMKNFKFSLNLTLSESRLKMDSAYYESKKVTNPYVSRYRRMSGQSPYLINTILEYGHKESGWSTNITFNVAGERLTILNTGGTPNIYEQPAPALDFNLQKKFSERLSASFRIKNILNPEIKQVYKFQGNADVYSQFDPNESVFSSYKKGTEYKLGLSYIF